MKILFLNTLDDPADGGGTEVTLWTLIRGLADAGHECVVLSTSARKGLKLVEREGVPVWQAGLRNIYWPGRRVKRAAPIKMIWHAIDSRNPFMQGQLRSVLEAENPDIVSSHNLPGWSVSAWDTIASLGIPIVQVLHDHYSLCVKSAMFSNGQNCTSLCGGCTALRSHHSSASSKVSAVVGVSEYILKRHLDFGRFSGVTNLHVIHNAREPGPLGIGTPDVEHDGIRFGFIGRLDQTKGVENLIDAFCAYHNDGAELWIAGGGTPEYEATLRERARDSRIKFIGRTSPREFYPNIDALIVPSLWNEPLGMVVAEAFAFGRPVVGAKRGGIPEMIKHDINGYLFEPDTAGDLLMTLERLGSDPQKTKSMGSSARESSRAYLDVRAWAERYVHIYNSVLDSETA